MKNGFITLHKKILDWEWYTDTVTLRVFIHLLLTANWKETRFKGFLLKRGDGVFGRESLAKTLGITQQSIRTAIKHLKSTSELTTKTTNRFSVYTIVNYDKYQNTENESTSKSTSELTNNQPATNQQLTTHEQYNNITNKHINNNNRGKFKKPTVSEIEKYCLERNNEINPEHFYDHYEANGWMRGKNKIKSWKACIRTWEKNNLYGKAKNGINKNTNSKCQRQGRRQSMSDVDRALEKAFGQSDIQERDQNTINVTPKYFQG